MTNPDSSTSQSQKKEQPSRTNWFLILLGGGGLAGIAAIITALNGPLSSMFEIIKTGSKNTAPEAQIEVDQPLTSNTNNTIEVAEKSIVKLNSYRSRDDEDGSDLLSHWYIDDEKVYTGDVFIWQFEKKDSIYTVALEVIDRGGKSGKNFYRVKVVDPKISNQPITDNLTDIPDADQILTNANDSPQNEDTDVQSYLPSKYLEWIHIKQQEELPREAFIAGLESSRNQAYDWPLYLCRAEYAGKKIAGKIVSDSCNIPIYKVIDGKVSNREEKAYSNYEVMIQKGPIVWVDHEEVPRDENNIPINTVVADERYGNIICRSEYSARGNSGEHPGVLNTDLDLCMFPWGGVVGYLSDYEVLVISE